MMRHRGAASLLEVVVAVTILAIVVPLLLSLFPSSLRTLARSEVLQQSVALGSYRMDEAPLVCHGPGLDLDEPRRLDARTYRICREFYQVDIYRMDVTVRVTTPGQAPLLLNSRFLYGDAL